MTGVQTCALPISNKIGEGSFVYRILNKDDLPSLQAFFESQNPEQFKYFQPHTFDRDTLKHLFKNSAFFMMGVFHNDKMVGYFFLRCFINKKCFIGRIVDKMYQGRGISKIMGRILLRTAWASKFRIFSTVSRDNIKSFNSSKSINNFRIVSELDNGFVFIEYIEESEKTY